MSDPPARIVIAGGSGFIGRSLARFLAERGHEVVVLSRTPTKNIGPWRSVAWDARTTGEWAREVDGARAIVNLTGRSVDCVKTPDHCDEILRSRVESTLALGRAISAAERRPRVWVQMSTAHIYGDPPSVACDEDSPTGWGLAPDVGRAWERAFEAACHEDVRGVVLRTSFVLGRDAGGPYAKLLRLARLGLGGRVGHGRQGLSWIHQHDMNRIFERAILDEAMRGVYVASAPQPVSQAEFSRELRRVAGGLARFGIAPPAPQLLVRLGARLVLRTDPELALYGRRVVSKRLREEGFAFDFPSLRGALEDLARRPE
ncbi:MAG: TIGR01777 family oxidoreductase [Phycisphaerales bacterium]|jgi:uncharacterized protein (TIGR01777 family)|nr:TIGR01777 family oxidoreductase [Phycisphaerales bacterium]